LHGGRQLVFPAEIFCFSRSDSGGYGTHFSPDPPPSSYALLFHLGPCTFQLPSRITFIAEGRLFCLPNCRGARDGTGFND
jgi:hypothetical protein